MTDERERQIEATIDLNQADIEELAGDALIWRVTEVNGSTGQVEEDACRAEVRRNVSAMLAEAKRQGEAQATSCEFCERRGAVEALRAAADVILSGHSAEWLIKRADRIEQGGPIR